MGSGTRLSDRHVLFLVAVACVPLVLLALQLPRQLHSVWDGIRNGQEMSRSARLLYAARVDGLTHPEVAPRTAEILPRDARYIEAVAPDAAKIDPGVASAVAFVQYWLYPRRRVPATGSFGWIIDWGVDPRTLDPHPSRVVEIAPRIFVIRTAH